MVQAVPFHRSARVTVVVERLGLEFPTAVQAVDDVQDTPSRTLMWPAVLGVVWMVHAVPSQCSAKVEPDPAFGYPERPTAVQSESDVHDTALNTLGAIAAFGLAWIVQLVPSQCSTNVDAEVAPD